MKTLYFHGKTTTGNRFTVAGAFNEEQKILTLGASLCSTKDNFNKKLGRVKAVGRLLSKKHEGKLNVPTNEFTIKNFVEENCAPLNELSTKAFMETFSL